MSRPSGGRDSAFHRTMTQHRLLNAGIAARPLRLSVPSPIGPTEVSIAAEMRK